MIDVHAIESFRYVKAGKKLLRNATEAIENFLSTDYSDELKMESLLSLGKIGDNKSLKFLMKALNDYPDFVEPITALGFFKDSTPVKKLLEKLDDPNVDYKEEIVKVLGEIGDPMSNRAMIELLHDDERMIRYYASWALYKTGGRDVVQSLCGLLNDSDEWVVINVLDILSKLKDPEAIPALVGQFETAQDSRLKAIIVSTLSSFDDGKLLKTFESGLNSFDPRILANSVEAISQLKIPASEMKRKLKKFYGHPNNRVRANVCIALAKAQPDKVLEEIVSMIEADDAGTRRSAAYVLYKIKVPHQKKYVTELLNDENFSVRKMALQAATKLKKGFAINETTNLLNDENQWVRRKAVICATQLESFPTVPIMELFEKENSSAVVEVILQFFVSRRMIETAPGILRRIRNEKEEELPWLISALGKLGAVKELTNTKKFLGHVRAEIISEYYRALLLNGDLTIFDEISSNLTPEKKVREQKLLTWIGIAGEIGQFIQKPEYFPTHLKEKLLEEINKDTPAITDLSSPDLGLTDTVNEFMKGVDLFNNKEYPKAKDFFENFLKIFPEHLDGRYYLAYSHYLLGSQDAAVELLEQINSTSPSHLNSALLLGQLYFRRKLWDRLIPVYEAITDFIPSDDKKITIKIYGALGLSYFHTKRYVEAIRALNEGLKANPRDLSSSYHLALCYYATGNLVFARDILENLRRILPKDSHVLKNVLDLLQRIETTM